MKNKNISVVIPAHNEENWLKLPLESLERQNFDGNYEIIVVNNASNDETVEVARRFDVKIIQEPKKGVSIAYQSGFEVARHPIIAATDADTIVSPDWLSQISRAFSSPETVGVFGPVTFHDANGYYNWLAKYGFTTFLKLNAWLHKPLFVGANMAVSKKAFHEVGGFKVSMESAPDVDLSQRVKKLGKVVYNKDMKVQTSARRLEDLGFRFFFDHALNYINVVWLRRPGKAKDFEDVR